VVSVRGTSEMSSTTFSLELASLDNTETLGGKTLSVPTPGASFNFSSGSSWVSAGKRWVDGLVPFVVNPKNFALHSFFLCGVIPLKKHLHGSDIAL
jgi:hypothetical protein